MSRAEGAGRPLLAPHVAGQIANTEGRNSRAFAPIVPSPRTRAPAIQLFLQGAVILRHSSPVPVDLTQYLAFNAPRTTEPVAQVVEHETFNLGVEGSSPSGLTNKVLILRI
jgi:hypothetical protein